MRVEREVLERGPKRSVLRERTVRGGRPVTRVVKRFHAPGWLDRWKDAHRATREYRALERLRAARLPAPAPVEVRRREGRWELVLEEVPGAVSLEDLLAGRAPWPLSRARAARTAARLWVDLERARLRHADPHPGNLLFDDRGRPWLVDAARLTVARPPGAAARRAAWVALAADVRERAHPGFRAVFLREVLRALPEADRRALGDPRALAAGIEREARARRRARGAKRLARWTRPGGAVEPDPAGGWRVHDADAARARGTVHRRVATSPAPAEAWRALGRWVEHGLPALAPLAFDPVDGRGPLVVVPAGARPLDPDTGCGLDPSVSAVDGTGTGTSSAGDPRDRARALGTWLGRLHDRGLDRPGLSAADLWLARDGSLLADALELEARDLDGLDPATRLAEVLARAAAVVDLDTPDARAALLGAYVAAQGGHRDERTALLAAVPAVLDDAATATGARPGATS